MLLRAVRENIQIGLLVCKYFIFDTLIFGYATLTSCKNSETEHFLSVVPISAGIGTGIFITSDSTMALKLMPELSLSSKMSPP